MKLLIVETLPFHCRRQIIITAKYVLTIIYVICVSDAMEPACQEPAGTETGEWQPALRFFMELSDLKKVIDKIRILALKCSLISQNQKLRLLILGVMRKGNRVAVG